MRLIVSLLLVAGFSAPAAAQTGNISGTITNANTGSGISSQVNIHNASGVLVTAVVSNGSGVYTTGQLPAGTYFLRTISAFFFNKIYLDVPCGQQCLVTSGTPVVVTAGATTPGINFALLPAGAVSGTVINQLTGLPIQNANVSVYTPTGEFARANGTGPSGTFNVGPLATGSYRVVASASGMVAELYDGLPCPSNCDKSIGTPVAVTEGAITSGLSFSLLTIEAGTGGITGVVRNASSNLALSGMPIEIYRADGTIAINTTTNASGVYSVTALTPGTYKIRTRSPYPSTYVDESYNNISCDIGCPLAASQGVVVTAATTTSGIDFDLAPSESQVRVLYLRPTDRPFRADYYRAIQNAVYDLRAWFPDQLSGITYSLATARPEICEMPHAAGYYPGGARTKLFNDAQLCAPTGEGLGRLLWVLYADIEDACNDPERLGVAGFGMVFLGSGDMKGLIGAPVIDSCNIQYVFPVGRYIGGLGHELGHGFGLPHPPECEQGLPTCEFGALMWSGYSLYPNTFLRAAEKVTLSQAPMLRNINRIQNNSFASGTANWVVFSSPNPFDILANINAGVLEFYRNPPPPGFGNQAVVLQPTGTVVTAHSGLLTQFELGNSSAVRKRIAVLVHDLDFSDLSVCTFWLPAGAPMRKYSMRTHTTKNWVNATISFYAATTGSDGGAYRLDRVSMAIDNMISHDRTDCVDPTAPVPTGELDGPELLVNGDFGVGTTAGWDVFGQIVPQLVNGVFQFFRPQTAPDPAGGILQRTNVGLAAGDVLTARLDFGNSSSVRRRVTVLLHDLDFSDLTACTFWLEPGQPLTTYRVTGFATRAWANATISIYAASVGDDMWSQLDNVSLRKTPNATLAGTGCAEPG